MTNKPKTVVRDATKAFKAEPASARGGRVSRQLEVARTLIESDKEILAALAK
jgi:hypothetical protein